MKKSAIVLGFIGLVTTLAAGADGGRPSIVVVTLQKDLYMVTGYGESGGRTHYEGNLGLCAIGFSKPSNKDAPEGILFKKGAQFISEADVTTEYKDTSLYHLRNPLFPMSEMYGEKHETPEIRVSYLFTKVKNATGDKEINIQPGQWAHITCYKKSESLTASQARRSAIEVFSFGALKLSYKEKDVPLF